MKKLTGKKYQKHYNYYIEELSTKEMKSTKLIYLMRKKIEGNYRRRAI